MKEVIFMSQAETETTLSPPALPPGYLSAGYYAAADNGTPYLRPEYVGTYAKAIAAELSIKATDFTAMTRELKRNNKRSLPFEAKETAVLELFPRALSLVRRKRASALLVEFIQKNTDAIHTPEDFGAFCRHCEAISGYLSMPL